MERQVRTVATAAGKAPARTIKASTSMPKAPIKEAWPWFAVMLRRPLLLPFFPYDPLSISNQRWI